MTIETMRYVPSDQLEGKHVISLHDLQDDINQGPYSYECSVCRQMVVPGSRVQLVNVVLQCPHCGAYNETLQNPGVPT